MKIKKFIGFLLIYLCLFSNTNAGIIISEILPNTTDDANLEYIELYNNGDYTESLSGYILKDKSEKEYIFGSGVFLYGFESRKFFRPETKILLNNSDEEIYLYDNLGNLIDSFFYDNSIKGELISKKVDENSDYGDIEIFSGEILQTGSLETQTGVIETNTGEINEFTGSLVDLGEIQTFSGEIIQTGSLETQTGVIESNTGEINEFTGSLDDLGEIQTFSGEILQTGSLETQTGVIEKQTGEINEFTGTLNNSGKIENNQIIIHYVNPIEIININLSEIIIQSGIGEDKLCKKNDCKVNLLYENNNSNLACEWDFDGGVFTTNETDLKCNPGFVTYNNLGDYRVKLKVYQKNYTSNFKETYLSFSNKILVNEKVVQEKINKIDDLELEEIKLENDDESTQENLNNTNSLSGEILVNNYLSGIYDYKNEIEIKKFEKIVQKTFSISYKKLKSGLKIYGKTIPNVEIIIFLKKKNNLGFLNYFINSTYASNSYITNSDNNGNYEFLINDFLFGDYELNSKIIDSYENTFKLKKVKNISLDQNYTFGVKKYVGEQNLKQVKKYLDSLNKDIKKDGLDKNIQNGIKDENLKSIIEIQGKIGKNKKLDGNTLYCFDTCSVNFDGSKSKGNINKYLWDFGNGDTFDGKNPSYVKYLNPGIYKVSLAIYGDNEQISVGEFLVNFTKKQKTKKTSLNNTKNKNLLINISDAGTKENKLNQKQNFNGILSYLIIMLIVIFLLFIILKKEKLI